MLTASPDYFKRTSKIIPPNSPRPNRPNTQKFYEPTHHPTYDISMPREPVNPHKSRENKDKSPRNKSPKQSPRKNQERSNKIPNIRSKQSPRSIRTFVDYSQPQHPHPKPQTKRNPNPTLNTVTFTDKNNPINKEFPFMDGGWNDEESLSKPRHHNILWSSDTLDTLKNIMEYINKHKLMQPLGHIVRYYINKYQPYDNKDYDILSVDTVPDDINREILILAYICEIHIKTRPLKNTIVSNSLIYISLGQIINEVLEDIFYYDRLEPTFEEVYMINIVNENISKTSTSQTRDIITSCYHLTKRIITYIELSQDHILVYMETLHLRTQDLDMSFLTGTQIREFLSIFQTKRSLYLRIFLVLSDYMLRERTILNNNWILTKASIIDKDDFVEMLDDMIMELVITITGYGIKLSEIGYP